MCVCERERAGEKKGGKPQHLSRKCMLIRYTVGRKRWPKIFELSPKPISYSEGMLSVGTVFVHSKQNEEL